MDTNKAHLLAKTLMLKYKLNDWSFEFDSAKKRFGCCNHRRKVISLSCILTDLNDEDKVRDTILHEIAHALLGCGYGHSRIFKLKCVEVGCQPRRAYGSEVIIPKAKYTVHCLDCGYEFQANKRFVKVWHKICHRKLGDKCQYLIYTENK